MQKHGLNVFTILLWGQSIQTALPPKRHFEEPTSAVDPGQLDECCSQSKFVSFCLLIGKTDTYVFVFGILGLSCKLFPYVSIFFRVCLIPRTLPGWKLMQTFILKPATPVHRWVLQVRGWGSARTFCKASLQTWNLLLGMCWVWWLFLLLMFLLDKKWDKNIDIACIYWFRPSEIYSYIYICTYIYMCVYTWVLRGAPSKDLRKPAKGEKKHPALLPPQVHGGCQTFVSKQKITTFICSGGNHIIVGPCLGAGSFEANRMPQALQEGFWWTWKWKGSRTQRGVQRGEKGTTKACKEKT